MPWTKARDGSVRWVEELVLAEPDAHMQSVLRRRVREMDGDREIELVRAPAESLPFADAWRFIADGCQCNRDSLATIEASPRHAARRKQCPGGIQRRFVGARLSF